MSAKLDSNSRRPSRLSPHWAQERKGFPLGPPVTNCLRPVPHPATVTQNRDDQGRRSPTHPEGSSHTRSGRRGKGPGSSESADPSHPVFTPLDQFKNVLVIVCPFANHHEPTEQGSSWGCGDRRGCPPRGGKNSLSRVAHRGLFSKCVRFQAGVVRHYRKSAATSLLGARYFMVPENLVPVQQLFSFPGGMPGNGYSGR